MRHSEALDGCRATFKADPKLRGTNGHLPDTFLSTPGWHKGVAFINGFNLGWYWPAVGPQMTLYVPGPLLKDGENELILLEVDGAPEDVTGQACCVCGLKGVLCLYIKHMACEGCDRQLGTRLAGNLSAAH